MSKLIDLTGMKFNRLTVLKFSHKDKWGKSYWMCKCDCGVEKIISGSKLKINDTKSCGCYKLELNLKQFTGENSNSWRGGVSKLKNKYPPEWTKQLREFIRQRDGHQCQYPECDYFDLNENKIKLHVHHIDGFKSNCQKYNLISLCNKHHRKVEHNPESWEEYFYSKTRDYEY